jgi:hypothetical protein
LLPATAAPAARTCAVRAPPGPLTVARRLPRIERAWLLDPARGPADLRAAVVALSAHGGDGGTVPREAVADAFLRFTERRARSVAWSRRTWRPGGDGCDAALRGADRRTRVADVVEGGMLQ